MLRSKRASVWHASPFERMGVWICIAFHPFFVWAGPQFCKARKKNQGKLRAGPSTLPLRPEAN